MIIIQKQPLVAFCTIIYQLVGISVILFILNQDCFSTLVAATYHNNGRGIYEIIKRSQKLPTTEVWKTPLKRDPI